MTIAPSSKLLTFQMVRLMLGLTVTQLNWKPSFVTGISMLNKLPHTCTTELRHLRTAFINDLHTMELSLCPLIETYLLDVACVMRDYFHLQLYVTPQYKVHSKYFGMTLSIEESKGIRPLLLVEVMRQLSGDLRSVAGSQLAQLLVELLINT